MKAQMDSPLACYLAVDLDFYSDSSNVYVLSWKMLKTREVIATKASDAYKHCKFRLRTVWQQFG